MKDGLQWFHWRKSWRNTDILLDVTHKTDVQPSQMNSGNIKPAILPYIVATCSSFPKRLQSRWEHLIHNAPHTNPVTCGNLGIQQLVVGHLRQWWMERRRWLTYCHRPWLLLRINCRKKITSIFQNPKKWPFFRLHVLKLHLQEV